MDACICIYACSLLYLSFLRLFLSSPPSSNFSYPCDNNKNQRESTPSKGHTSGQQGCKVSYIVLFYVFDVHIIFTAISNKFRLQIQTRLHEHRSAAARTHQRPQPPSLSTPPSSIISSSQHIDKESQSSHRESSSPATTSL